MDRIDTVKAVKDLDLHLDDEHVRIHGKGGSVRTVLLDDRGYVALLKLYLARAGYTAGPLFRASINGRCGPLSYDAAVSATLLLRRRNCTRCWTTRSPMPRSAPPARDRDWAAR
ncbi:hypothetical protein ACBJ59_54340 [Nonomuraea sp. MTCD27]|uniref:hypothetical protein n=1 Tax=Nonomuraea sp. MTCD27 TaxID=1676747 RepID=UPI0035C052A6